MFRIRALQAEYGDCLLVSYGPTGDLRHIVVDGGFSNTGRSLRKQLEELKGDSPKLRLEAIVVTHVDSDHINGIISLLRNKPTWLEIDDIWFNGRRELSSDGLGPARGDILSDYLPKKYNLAFDQKSVRVDHHTGAIAMAGGIAAWVLSPTRANLARLAEIWPEDEPAPPSESSTKPPGDTLGHGDTWPPNFLELLAEEFEEDDAAANGSSIALLLKYNGKTVLLAGDAFPTVVNSGIEAHFGETRLKVNLLKISHHGSKGNTSSDFLRAIECNTFLISTNGTKFGHPDHAAIARMLQHAVGKPRLLFNYDTPEIGRWKARPMGWPGYLYDYPREGQTFVEIDLEDAL